MAVDPVTVTADEFNTATADEPDMVTAGDKIGLGDFMIKVSVLSAMFDILVDLQAKLMYLILGMQVGL